MTSPARLKKLSVVQKATQKNVTGSKNWAAVKKDRAYGVVEATTGPRNILEEWKQITLNDLGKRNIELPKK